jgi:hypothetical protein
LLTFLKSVQILCIFTSPNYLFTTTQAIHWIWGDKQHNFSHPILVLMFAPPPWYHNQVNIKQYTLREQSYVTHHNQVNIKQYTQREHLYITYHNQVNIKQYTMREQIYCTGHFTVCCWRCIKTKLIQIIVCKPLYYCCWTCSNVKISANLLDLI